VSTPHPRKRLGQHFLHDPNIIQKIIAAIAPASNDHFVEIGPGRGALTFRLLERVGRLDVIEIDRDLAQRLRQQTEDPGFTVHAVDALGFDYTALATDGASLRLAGNLPYNISTPLLFHFLRNRELFSDLHVMLQKEVVQRMAAPPGSRTYGRLSVSIQARCRVCSLFDISPGCFLPPPKVDSSFVRLVPDAQITAGLDNDEAFDHIVSRAFSMRRKKLSNCLRESLGAEEIRSAGVDPDARAETLGVAEFIRLANRFAAKTAGHIRVE